MKYLSVCSGIEAASVAFEPLGWKPLAFSEIEAFPRAVLAHHYPNVPIHGDFTALKDEPWIVDADMLCGGTPCQAFSVAGNRKSLADDRGNLTLQFVLLADAIDHLRSDAGREPAWILWENVPGVLSTNDNAFGAFLGGLVGRSAPIPEPEGGWTRAGVVDGPSRCAAWRVLDAQHFGLAQRRQRVFVLARGGAGRWAAADALLPIIESSGWHPAPSRSKGEGIAVAVEGGIRTGIDLRNGCMTGEVSMSVQAGGMGEDRGLCINAIPHIADTVTSKWSKGAEVLQQGAKDGGNCIAVPSPLLVRMREGKEGGGKGPLVSEDQSLTLATGNDQVLAFNIQSANSCAMRGGGDALAALPTDVARAVDTAGFTANQGGTVALGPKMQVRRLTPVECERLQGFPDHYTRIPWRGKPADQCPDGPRYKALGNSWAVNCARYIGERIKTCMTT